MLTYHLTEQIQITQKGEIIHFDVNLPDNVSSITGIATSVQINNELDIDTALYLATHKLKYSYPVALLRMNGGREQDWFVSYPIRDTFGVHSSDSFFKHNQTQQLPYIHHSKNANLFTSIVPDTTRVKGYIKDLIGYTVGKDISYTITLHITIAQ